MKLSNIEALVRDLTMEVRREHNERGNGISLEATRNEALGMLNDDERREYRKVKRG